MNFFLDGNIPFQYESHFSIIVIALRQPNKISILNKVKWIIEDSNINDFKNTVILLKDTNYKIYKK